MYNYKSKIKNDSAQCLLLTADCFFRSSLLFRARTRFALGSAADLAPPGSLITSTH